MSDEAIKFGLTTPFEATPRDRKIYGVALAMVLENMDSTGEARVRLMLPWLPGYTPWARLATLMAGFSRGSFFVPQVGDEVLVAFNQGDVREPYVVGALWNTIDRPPALAPIDAVNIRRIRTPLGHELSFDDALQEVTLSNTLMTQVKLTATEATISTPTASVTLGLTGDVTVESLTKISLHAPIVEIKADAALSLESQGVAKFKAAAACAVEGKVVKIN